MVGWCGFGGPTNKISRIELDPAAAYDEYTRKHTLWVEEGSKGPTKKIMFYMKRIFEWRDEYNVKRPVREESKNREGEPWWRWVHRERNRANARAVKSNCEQEWAQESKVNAWGMNEQTNAMSLNCVDAFIFVAVWVWFCEITTLLSYISEGRDENTWNIA